MEVKKTYLKELKKERRAVSQRRLLWKLITETIGRTNVRKKQYWANKMYAHFSERFISITKDDWIHFLSELSDSQAWGSYQDPMIRRYCLLIRDAAKERIKEYED